MTNQQILIKAIQKAIDGGWKPEDWVQGAQHLTQSLLQLDKVNTVIFSHDFAKALWGEKVTYPTANEWRSDGHAETAEFVGPIWQYHLQQMVIADDPTAYLGENI